MTLGRDDKSFAEQKETLRRTLIDDQGEERRRDNVSEVAFRVRDNGTGPGHAGPDPPDRP